MSLICGKCGSGMVCSPSFGPKGMRHMLQGARKGTFDAGQSLSRRADRPPAARAGAERADGRELHPAQWDLPPHLLLVAQEVRRPHRDRGHPAQAPGARECPLEGAARRSGARARGPEGDQRQKMERVAVRRAQVRYAMPRRLSCRLACALLRVARSALAYAARRPGRDAVLVTELQRLAAAHPRYGYRRMCAAASARARRQSETRAPAVAVRRPRAAAATAPAQAPDRGRAAPPTRRASSITSSTWRERWAARWRTPQGLDGRRLVPYITSKLCKRHT